MIRFGKKIHINFISRKRHGTFDEEWPPHKKVSGWWYVTGYLTDKNYPNDFYAYQYNIALAKMFSVTSYILHISLADLQTNSHLFKQEVRLRRGKNIYANDNEVVFAPYASLNKGENQFKLALSTTEFDLNLSLQKGKGAIWHCDNGILVMGLPQDLKQRTVYYSYPNLPTKGILVIRNNSEQPQTLEVIGKGWFDRQWGPFRLLDAKSHWEWFSLRFFDDEEIMLFSFPQHPYIDGTYINKQGQTTRLQNYEIKPKNFVEAGPYKYTFSFGWDLIIPGFKEEKYEIKPLMDSMFNIAYFELLAEILNARNERVGYCFVELQSGARNKTHFYQNIGNLIKKE